MTARRARLATSVGLSAFFLVVYGGAERIAAARRHVPSFYFGWERHVPFVAAAVVPYLSIDLFFVVAPFLVAPGRPLRRYATRVVVAVAVAGACFVLMPLRFAFDRPAGGGWVGTAWGWFLRSDLPLNQLPSLHVTLLVIVGDVYLRRATGRRRAALLIWFGLIAASPLLTRQHHAADLVAGLALGLLCLHLFPDEPRQPFGRNGRVAVYYGVAGAALLWTCVAAGRGGWPLWWPTVSLLAVAAGYAVGGPAVYGKRDGRLGWTGRLLFGPTLLGQHASMWWYARRGRPFHPVTDRLWIGRKPTRRHAATLLDLGIDAVVDLTCEFTEPAALRGGAYLHLPTLDLTAPTPSQVARAVAFIDRQAGRTHVYVHCKAGYSRTAVVAAAYLLATGRAGSADEALQVLRRARPGLIVRPEARRAVDAYAASHILTHGTR